MKMDLCRQISPTTLIALFVLILQGCDKAPVGLEQFATITGKIVEENTLRPIAGATVTTIPFDLSTQTDENGNYTLTVELVDTASIQVSLVITKDGFETLTMPARSIKNGRVTTFPDAFLVLSDAAQAGPRLPASVVLVGIQSAQIYVLGSGANVTSDLTFEVRDKFGDPLDIDNQVRVDFRLTGGPGGGEFISPDTARTNFGGRVKATVHSGTKAGAVQVVAGVNGTAVSSAPIPISIHGWLPDAAHFSVGPDKLNFAGYNILGLTNKITAFVGDKFSNPVPPGTSVRFSSTGGIISGSAVTDELGRASATLMSALPQPQGIPELPFPFNQPGFAKITAQTVDENKNEISKSTVVLFSGVTEITNLNPRTFDLAPGASQQFSFVVSDQNGNPLVSGTSITVSASSGELSGDVNVVLQDTQSRADTQFSFVLTNSPAPQDGAKSTTLTITVRGQNGNASETVTGTMQPKP